MRPPQSFASRAVRALLAGAALSAPAASLAQSEDTRPAPGDAAPPEAARAGAAGAGEPAVDPAENPASNPSAEPASGTTTRRTFTPQDFARFAPRSALDMAQQIPGFAIREGDGARGLGQADTNVIVNGRRISGKSNGPVAALQRIPADEVVRLELVDGASLDIGGLTGQVLNVVTASSGDISGQFSYAPQFRSFGTDPRLYEGRIAIAGGGAKTNWTLAFDNTSARMGDEGPELVFDGAGALIDTREEQRTDYNDAFGLSGSLTRVATGGNILNLTGEINGFLRRETELSQRSGTSFPVDRVRDFRFTEDEYNFEIGADYQFALGPGRLKLIGYHRYEDSPTVSFATTFFADERPPEGNRFARDADEGETIARAEYAFGALGGELLIAAEGVRNFLDITSALEVRDAAGVLQPVELEGASARVDEDRAELQATYSRSLARGLQFQLSLAGEYSRISQSGPLGQTRTFYRPKGFVSLDWKPSPRVNIAARIERLVGQLDFFDFIASVDLNQDRTDVTNADLKPEQSWRAEIEANVSLGALGTLNLRPFYEDITDIVDQIPIEGGGQAPGNLPSARAYGIETDLTLLSEGLGWRGTRMDVSLALGGSSVRDPLLGNTRELSGNELLTLMTELRHDLQQTSWAFGGDINYRKFAEEVRLDEIFLIGETFAFARGFIENKDVAGMTVRFTVANLLDRSNLFERTVFLDRANDLVAFFETRRRRFGTIFTFELEGSF